MAKSTTPQPNKRWSADIKYHNGRTDHYQIDELYELQDIVEQGPDWSYMKEIKITYNWSK